MASQCEICHARPSKANPVWTLSEVVHGDENAGPRLHLCRACVTRREVRAWPADDKIGRVVLRGLAGHPETYSDRFTYFEDAKNVHVLRLRAEWAHRHQDHELREPPWEDSRIDLGIV